MKYKKLVLLILIGAFVQTALYSLLLLIAYNFWTAPNASLIIGTVFPFLISGFFIIVLIQNLFMLFSEKLLAWVSLFLFSLVIVPFIYPVWFSLLLILFSAFILYIPSILKKWFLQ